LGLRAAQYDFVAILDCDMAPNPKWVESYMELLIEDDDVALIGPRKYVDTSAPPPSKFRTDKTLIEKLPEVKTNNTVAGKEQQSISVDWRIDHFKETEDLRLCDTPFRFFSGGNVAFARKWLNRAGWFDEEFTHWGGEDNEFGYRLYRQGCFFRAVKGGIAYHQEPPGKENETDRAEGKRVTINIVREKVPYFYRKITPLAASSIHKRPLVSIYIPAYNCAEHIVRCVDSALNQTVVDLEVCICNDGSTDDTLAVLTRHYGKNPRVRVENQLNGGIAKASNGAVRMTRGFYIGQLDSDDYLEPDAVELCLKEFLSNRKLACVYTTNRNVKPDGSLISTGYNWPIYSREKLTTAMIAHHFRMFTARAWHLTQGFDESIANAVDYDMYLKLSEVGPFMHINKVCYNRVLHGENTSIKKIDIQKLNHFKSVNMSLTRQHIKNHQYMPTDPHDPASRGYRFEYKSNIDL
jgi:chondroitin synthase